MPQTAERTLDEQVRAVLAVPYSPLSVTARAVLAGAHAALRSALDAADQADPGRAHCAGLAGKLAGLLASAGAQQDSGLAAQESAWAARPAPSDARAGALDAVTEAFHADTSVRRFVGASPRVAQEPGDTWRALWLACLRIEPRAASSWRQSFIDAIDEPGTQQAQWITLPLAGLPPQVLIEPAPELGVTGLRLAAQAQVIDEVAEALGPADAGWRLAVAELATLVLALTDLDSQACHSLEGVRISGMHALSLPENRSAYRHELVRRLTELREAAHGSAGEVQALRLVDEALCSVVHRPPAHAYSWWGQLADRSRSLLGQGVKALRDNAVDAELRVLELKPYTELMRYTSGRDISFQVPGNQAGTVLACLRTWLRVGNDVRPGRVIFGGE